MAIISPAKDRSFDTSANFNIMSFPGGGCDQVRRRFVVHGFFVLRSPFSFAGNSYAWGVTWTGKCARDLVLGFGVESLAEICRDSDPSKHHHIL